jgi:hypothetical protein
MARPRVNLTRFPALVDHRFVSRMPDSHYAQRLHFEATAHMEALGPRGGGVSAGAAASELELQ